MATSPEHPDKPSHAETTDAPEAPADLGAPCQLVLMKREHRWVFRYRRGEEATVLRGLAETARDTANDFDWFDAAVLSHQMGDRMHQQLKDMMPG